jgi:integrase
VRVRLKGINKVKKRLADGTLATYYYAWKGGPRLQGTPGSPEFIAAYNQAVEQLKQRGSDVLVSVLDAYESSADFRQLADRTRADYKKHLRAIAGEFGDFPLAALPDRRSRGRFLEWRDQVALASPRNADYRFAVFARALSWAHGRGLVLCNPLERPGRLYRADRNDSVWTAADEKAFLEHAPEHLHLALHLALWTGQRQGDLLAITWNAYDGDYFRLKQRKTGRRIVIPVAAPLRIILDEAKSHRRDAVTILATEGGRTWTSSGFRSSWRKACAKANIADLTFHDLRGTAVTRLAQAGCTVAEIATITGHSLADVNGILDGHYLSRDLTLAQSAIRKLETRTNRPTERPTAPAASGQSAIVASESCSKSAGNDGG